MPKMLVIRHSKAIANEQGILMGSSLQMNSDLSENGVAIAHAKGAALRAAGFKPNKVYCSGLKRAIQTAEIIVEELGLHIEIIKLAELNERDFGQYDGKPYRFVLEAVAKYPKDPPTVEPDAQFIARVVKAFETIKAASTGTTLVVTHSNPEMVMQAAALNPAQLQAYARQGDAAYCEGFEYEW